MKHKEKMKECYGHYSSEEPCRKCIFKNSCELYTRTEPGISSRLRLTSLDNTLHQWIPAPESDTPGNDDTVYVERNEMLSALAQMLKWIMSLDSYTLGIVAELISPRDAVPGEVNVAYLSRIRGCTRQAMHEKMLAAAEQFPELAALFQTALRKVGNLKSKFEHCSRKKRNQK